jgi:hypothetical protein
VENFLKNFLREFKKDFTPINRRFGNEPFLISEKKEGKKHGSQKKS